MHQLIEVYDNEPKNENNQTIRAIEQEKQKSAVERCFLLYEKGKIKNEVNRLMFRKNSELKVKKELDDCTFKPKLNNNYQKITTQKFSSKSDINTYKRNVYWKSRSIEKYVVFVITL